MKLSNVYVWFHSCFAGSRQMTEKHFCAIVLSWPRPIVVVT